ncbi:hypothetical protein CEQ90_12975 [Lewinellaceae bacterium SD302]|nr:hypothetical protein CEQ90_12975 [Lewinellaceae bacterium SD302]
MNRMAKLLCLLFTVLIYYYSTTDIQAQAPAPVGYDFDHPTLLAKLPKKLKEISGLSLSPRNNELLAVQDEDGLFFRLDIRDGQLLGSTEFWKDGDYEGIEAVGEDIWIVKSTGTLYKITNPGTGGQEVTKYNGFLSEENDVEGLTYDRANNRLLLSCKSHYGGFTETRSVFSFDLATRQFKGRPVFTVGREALKDYLMQCPKSSRHEKIFEFVSEKKDFNLGPSAIGIHPITGRIFIASSAGKLILVLTPDGKVEHLRRLDKKIFPQPEGLAFTSDGTLYISTEARDDEPAKIYRLPYQPGFNGL